MAGPFGFAWLRPVRHPLVALGIFLVGGWIFVALFAGLLAPYDPLRSIVPLAPPGSHGPHGETFWLGTDFLGRDFCLYIGDLNENDLLAFLQAFVDQRAMRTVSEGSASTTNFCCFRSWGA